MIVGSAVAIATPSTCPSMVHPGEAMRSDRSTLSRKPSRSAVSETTASANSRPAFWPIGRLRKVDGAGPADTVAAMTGLQSRQATSMNRSRAAPAG